MQIPVSQDYSTINLYGFKLFSPSYKSAFQLSLAVLVRYRSSVAIFSLGGNTSPVFILHFQAVLLNPRKRPRMGF